MLSKERYSLLTSLDLGEELVNVGAFPDEVGSPSLHGLVLLFIFIVLNDLPELFKV